MVTGITISRKEAAEIIGITENTLSQWCKQGMIAFTKKNPLKKNSPYLFTRSACIAAANKSIHTIPVNTGETGERKPCQYSKEEKSGTGTTRRQAASASRSLLAQRTRSKHRSYTTNESLNCGA